MHRLEIHINLSIVPRERAQTRITATAEFMILHKLNIAADLLVCGLSSLEQKQAAFL